MVNWKAIGFGVSVTLILAYLGNFIPYLGMSIAPIVGGIIAGYIVGGSFKNGIIYGGFSAGTAGFIYTFLVVVLTAGISKATAVSMNIYPSAVGSESGIVTAIIIGLSVILAFGTYFIMGVIGGIIGIAIKEREAEKQIFRK
jgi:hypothetical protein